MKKIIHIASFVPLAVLVFVYAAHALLGFIGSDEYYTIVNVLGLSSATTAFLVFLVGPLDAFVAALLLVKDRLAPELPWSYLYGWVGFWPWVPRAMEWYGGLPVEYGEALSLSVLAAFAYYVHVRRRATPEDSSPEEPAQA